MRKGLQPSSKRGFKRVNAFPGRNDEAGDRRDAFGQIDDAEFPVPTQESISLVQHVFDGPVRDQNEHIGGDKAIEDSRTA